MRYECFNLGVANHIGHLELNRPEAYNSMNRTFWKEFPEAIQRLDAESNVRVLVISAQGKHFCSGMDLEVFTEPDQNLFKGEAGRRAESIRRLVMQLQDCFTVMETARFPVISAVQGGCVGGALDLICATDMRFCTEDAFFTVKETALGMTADLGTLQRLPGLIPAGLARELAYTARKMHSQEALSSGLVNQVFAESSCMLSKVMKIAEQIADHSPLAVTGTKQMINYARDHSLHDSLNYMATWQSGMFQPNDMMQTFSAKVSGKTPEFEPLHTITQPLQQAE